MFSEIENKGMNNGKQKGESMYYNYINQFNNFPFLNVLWLYVGFHYINKYPNVRLKRLLDKYYTFNMKYLVVIKTKISGNYIFL